MATSRGKLKKFSMLQVADPNAGLSHASTKVVTVAVDGVGPSAKATEGEGSQEFPDTLLESTLDVEDGQVEPHEKLWAKAAWRRNFLLRVPMCLVSL